MKTADERVIGANATEYIEIFYNRQRRQSRLGYPSPASFAKNSAKRRRGYIAGVLQGK